MNSKRWFICFLSILISATAFAKLPTEKLAVSGPGLPQAVEITQGPAIDASIWGGTFMDKQAGIAEAPGEELPRYTVKFYVKYNDEVQLRYVVYYVWDVANDRALVQIPGTADEWYWLNVSAISRCCQGKWFRASDSWSNAIKAVLPVAN